MVRVSDGTGARIAVEIWSVPPGGLRLIFFEEPSGLSIGKVHLDDGTTVIGVIAEPALVDGQPEITKYGGWRAYLAAKGVKS